MRTVSSGLPPDAKRGAVADEVLMRAYRSLFMSGDENAQIVLADIINYGGLFRLAPFDSSLAGFAELNGRRAVALRITGFINLTQDEIEEIINAARTEERANRGL